jgi:hypothetical protein
LVPITFKNSASVVLLNSCLPSCHFENPTISHFSAYL